MSSNEGAVQLAICEYLDLKRYFFWRQNNTGVYDPKTKRFRRLPKYAIKGVSDIIVVHKGRVIFLEVKDKSSQSEYQKNFEKNIIKNDLEYYLVRSIDDVINKAKL